MHPLKRFGHRLLARLGWQVGRLGRPLGFEWLIAAEAARAERLYFVQIGAHDGSSNDPIRRFVLEFGWHGVLLEPQRDVFERLAENYAGRPGLALINAALAERDGRRPLYRVRADAPGVPAWASGLASFDRATLLSHAGQIAGLASLVVTEDVECLSWSSLSARLHLPRIDLLQVDAEGGDFELLELVDYTGAMIPRIIHYEHKHLSPASQVECQRFLVEKGYSLLVEHTDSTAWRPGP